MKHFYSRITQLLITGCILLSVEATSQTATWFEPGSTWTYNFGIPTGPEHYSAVYKIEGPVEIDGHAAYKMILDEGSGFMLCSAPAEPPFYFYEQNDSVFYTTEQEGPFHLLFDFSAEVGDSWNVNVTTDAGAGYVTYTVLQKETEDIAGADLIKLTLEGTASEATGIEVENPVVVYETIGATSYFFAPLGHIGFSDCVTTPVLQCFLSPSMNYLNPDFENCELETGIASVEKLTLSVFPNPVMDELEISSEDMLHSVRIVDMRGSLLLEKTVDGVFVKIDVSDLPAGVYFLLAATDKGVVKKQFVKEQF